MKRKANYVLRRNLVLWRAEEIIAEVEKYCTENKVDEVMWTFEGEEFNLGIPTIDSIQKHLHRQVVHCFKMEALKKI